MSILMLKNATLAQLHPAKVEEGVDIVRRVLKKCTADW